MKPFREFRSPPPCRAPRKRVTSPEGKPALVAGDMLPCHLELAYVGERDVKRAGAPTPGLYLRGCDAAGERGSLVPVGSYAEAKAVAEKVCACKGENPGATTKSCAEKIRTS